MRARFLLFKSRVPVVAWLGLTLLLASSEAKAQAIDAPERYLLAASQLYRALEYERALEQLKRARTVSKGVGDDALIARYEGIILFDAGKPEEAAAAFREALYLEPDAVLPLKVSPKISATFEATRVTVKKNKVAPPFRVAEFDIMYNEGISTVGDLLDLGVTYDILTKRGAFYRYNEELIGQGRETSKEYLRQNPIVAAEIDALIRAKVGLPARAEATVTAGGG